MNNLDQYNELADSWWATVTPFAALKRLNEPRVKFFNRFVPSWAQKSVCDVGCGGGYLSETLAQLGAVVHGVDISEKSVAAARAHAIKMGYKINYNVGNAIALPFPNATFDVVVCVDVLEHVGDVPAALAEAQRVLRPGGLFLFDTVNRSAFSKFVMVTFLENVLKAIPKGTHDANLFIRPEEMSLMCARAGLGAPQLIGLSPKSFHWPTRSFGLAVGGPKWVMYAGAAKKPA